MFVMGSQREFRSVMLINREIIIKKLEHRCLPSLCAVTDKQQAGIINNRQ